MRFYLLRTPVAHGGKKLSGIYLKTSKLLLFNCEPGRIDHADLEDSNFEGEEQPPNRRLQKYDRYQNSKYNCKPKIFDLGVL